LAVLRDEIKALIIVLGSIAVLSVLIIVISGSKFFTRYDKYYTKVTNAAGLEVGAQVRVGGVRSGRVLDIIAPADPGELVTIVIGITDGTPLYRGTTARISQIGFVGDIYLLLTVKGTEAGRIEPGSTIPSVEAVEFSELMAELDELGRSVESLIKDVNQIFSDENIKGLETLVKNSNVAITNASENLSAMTSSVRETTERIQMVMDDIGSYVAEGGDVDQVFNRTKADLDAAEDAIKAFQESAKRISDASDKVGNAVGHQDRNLDEVMANLNETMLDLQDLLQTLNVRPWSVIHKEKKPDVEEDQ